LTTGAATANLTRMHGPKVTTTPVLTRATTSSCARPSPHASGLTSVLEIRVGAALLGTDGQIFTGLQRRERELRHDVVRRTDALVKAASEGVREFESMAIATSIGRR